MASPAAVNRGQAQGERVRRFLPSSPRTTRSRPITSSGASVTTQDGWKKPFGVTTKSAGTFGGRDTGRWPARGIASTGPVVIMSQTAIRRPIAIRGVLRMNQPAMGAHHNRERAAL